MRALTCREPRHRDRFVAGRQRGLALSGSTDWTGIEVETLPGGGEPSAVKSDFCSVSDFGAGTGVAAGLFMATTFAV